MVAHTVLSVTSAISASGHSVAVQEGDGSLNQSRREAGLTKGQAADIFLVIFAA